MNTSMPEESNSQGAEFSSATYNESAAPPAVPSESSDLQAGEESPVHVQTNQQDTKQEGQSLDDTVEDEEDEDISENEAFELYKVPDDCYGLFFPPWTMRDTAEAKMYLALSLAVKLEVQPQDLFDEMMVVDITNSIWEQQRVSNSVHNIIQATRREALIDILAPMFGHNYDRASDVAADYFSGDESMRRPIIGLLRAHGLGLEAISAHAVAKRAPILAALNRITVALGVRREDIVREVERRRETRAARRTRRSNRSVSH